MLDTIGSILMLGLFAVYAYAGDSANYYLKYHLLNQRAEVYSDTGNYIVQRIIYAVILGWLTIPVALIYYYVKSNGKNGE